MKVHVVTQGRDLYFASKDEQEAISKKEYLKDKTLLTDMYTVDICEKCPNDICHLGNLEVPVSKIINLLN